MKKRCKNLTIFFIIILIIWGNINSQATSCIDKVLGEKTANAMLEEISSRIDDHSTMTYEMFYEIVYDVTHQYGIDVNEDIFNEILTYISISTDTEFTSKISPINQIKILIDDLINFFETTFPSVKEKKVTITIPKISQIDEWVDMGIHYFKRNVLPLIVE